MQYDQTTIRLLFEQSAHGMALIRINGQFEYANAAFRRMLGYSPDELARVSYLEVTHPDDVEHSSELAQLLLDGEREAVRSEPRYLARDGRVVHTETDSVLLRDESGRPYFFFAQVRDISGRRVDSLLLHEERRLMEMITKGEELDSFLRQLVNAVGAQLAEGQVLLLRADNAGQALSLHTGLRMPPEYALRLMKLPVASDGGFISRAAFLNRRLVIPDLSDDLDRPPLEGSPGVLTGWAFPIRTRSNMVVGVLAFIFSGPRDPEARELDQIERLNRIAGIGIERDHADRLLRVSEERYALALRGANDGIWDWDVKADRLYVSERWRDIVGLRGWEQIRNGRAWMRRLHPLDRRPTYLRLSAHLEGRSAHFEAEYRMRQPDGSYRWVLSRGVVERDREGRPERMAGSLSDIAERKAAEARLEYEALHDSLTGLPNRLFFLNRLERCLRGRPTETFAVLNVDMDRFKHVNDSLGNTLGDALLVNFARRLREHLGGAHLLARMGGDEFTILVECRDADRVAEELAARLVPAMAESFRIEEYEVHTGASIGVVVPDARYLRPEDVLRDADAAMQRAKERGRSRYVVFDERMQEMAREVALIETLIKRALDEDGLALYYQPIVELAGRRVVACEALLRLTLPETMGMSPEKVVRVAEETGLILALGEWVLREACGFVSRLHAQGIDDVRVAVNVSARQFRHTEFTSRVAQILRETGISGSNLTLELTEGLFVGFEDEVLSALTQLRQLGLQLAIDDFGTGYSSLAYLKRLPIDILKIDRSFVGGIPKDEEGAAISAAVVALGHILQIRVVAEGVEQSEQIDFLTGFECDYIQGYAVSKPLSELEFVSFVTKSRSKSPVKTEGS